MCLHLGLQHVEIIVCEFCHRRHFLSRAVVAGQERFLTNRKKQMLKQEYATSGTGTWPLSDSTYCDSPKTRPLTQKSTFMQIGQRLKVLSTSTDGVNGYHAMTMEMLLSKGSRSGVVRVLRDSGPLAAKIFNKRTTMLLEATIKAVQRGHQHRFAGTPGDTMLKQLLLAMKVPATLEGNMFKERGNADHNLRHEDAASVQVAKASRL
jgi:hypothetical protein